MGNVSRSKEKKLVFTAGAIRKQLQNYEGRTILCRNSAYIRDDNHINPLKIKKGNRKLIGVVLLFGANCNVSITPAPMNFVINQISIRNMAWWFHDDVFRAISLSSRCPKNISWKSALLTKEQFLDTWYAVSLRKIFS